MRKYLTERSPLTLIIYWDHDLGVQQLKKVLQRERTQYAKDPHTEGCTHCGEVDGIFLMSAVTTDSLLPMLARMHACNPQAAIILHEANQLKEEDTQRLGIHLLDTIVTSNKPLLEVTNQIVFNVEVIRRKRQESMRKIKKAEKEFETSLSDIRLLCSTQHH